MKMNYCEKHRIYYLDERYCVFCNDEKVTVYCENKDQAQALANFLWNEKMRHRKDVCLIEIDLDMLKEKWDVEPSNVIAFVKP